jgi:hypothetical protein
MRDFMNSDIPQPFSAERHGAESVQVCLSASCLQYADERHAGCGKPLVRRADSSSRWEKLEVFQEADEPRAIRLISSLRELAILKEVFQQGCASVEISLRFRPDGQFFAPFPARSSSSNDARNGALADGLKDSSLASRRNAALCRSFISAMKTHKGETNTT